MFKNEVIKVSKAKKEKAFSTIRLSGIELEVFLASLPGLACFLSNRTKLLALGPIQTPGSFGREDA